jgi:hypothetical protein
MLLGYQGRAYFTDMPISKGKPPNRVQNAQQFIAVGYDQSTKGMHKSVLPTARYN